MVSVCVAARPANVSLAVGNAKLVVSVPVKVIELLTVNVLPAAIFKVLVPLLVMVRPLILPPRMSPAVVTWNLVVPDAEASMRSPELVLLIINAPLLPMPPEIESGAGVVALPTKTDEL